MSYVLYSLNIRLGKITLIDQVTAICKELRSDKPFWKDESVEGNFQDILTEAEYTVLSSAREIFYI